MLVSMSSNMDRSNRRDDTSEFFCELCSLEFTHRNEKEEHTWSMLHNTNLNKKNGRECTHECALCKREFVGLMAFTSHLHDEEHRDKLCGWRKHTHSQEDKVQSRQGYKSGPSAIRASEHMGTSGRGVGDNRESHRSTDGRAHPHYRYHWTSANHKSNIPQESQGGPLKERRYSSGNFEQLDLSNSSVIRFAEKSGNGLHSDSRETKVNVDRLQGGNPNPETLDGQRSAFDFNRNMTRDRETALRVRHKEAAKADRYRGLPKRRHSTNSERSYTSESRSGTFRKGSHEMSGASHFGCTEKTNEQEERTPDSEIQRHQQPTGNNGFNILLTSDKSESNLSLNSSGGERSSRKGRPRKVAKHLNNLGEFTGKHIQSFEKSLKEPGEMELTGQHADSSCLNETDEQKSNETRADLRSVSLRDPYVAQQYEASLQKETSAVQTVANATCLPANFESASSQRQQQEALRVLLGVKKEPGTESEGSGSWFGSVKVKEEPHAAECTSSPVPQVPAPIPMPSQHQCHFMHIDGVRCGATALDNYCSYHQRVTKTQQNPDQEASTTSIHTEANPDREIDLSSTLDRIGDLHAAATSQSNIRTIDLSDTVAQPGRIVFEQETNRCLSERDSADRAKQPRRVKSPRLRENSYQAKDSLRPHAVPLRVLGFNHEKLDHPGGNLPKVSAFSSLNTKLSPELIQSEYKQHTRASNSDSNLIEAQESRRCSPLPDQTKEQADSSVGMIDLSSSSQFLGLPHAYNTAGSEATTPRPRHPVGRSSFELPTKLESPVSSSRGVVAECEPGRSASAQFVNLPRGASPLPREHLRTNSPNPSNLTVDLARFNLPSSVRRALAVRLGTKKKPESAEDVTANFASLPRRFVDEPTGQLSKQTRDFHPSRKTIFTPVRRRLQRSVSLDSRPNRLDALQQEHDTLLSSKEVRKASPVFGKAYSHEESSSLPQEPSLSIHSGGPSSASGLQSSVLASVRPPVLVSSSQTRARAVSPLETRGMIDLSSVTYLQAAGEISSMRKGSSSSQTLREGETRDGEESQAAFHDDSENVETFGFSQVASKRKRLRSFDEAVMSRQEADGKTSVKKLRSQEENKHDGALISYTPAVNIQELLIIEGEEQRQMGALTRVQGRLKDVRGKIQKLCSVLDTLHSEENSITTRIDQLRSERLGLLQSALCEQRDHSLGSSRGSLVASSSAEAPLNRMVRPGVGDADLSSLSHGSFSKSLSERNAPQEEFGEVGDDAHLAPPGGNSFLKSDCVALQDRPGAVEHASAEDSAPHVESCPLREDPFKDRLPEDTGTTVWMHQGEADTDYETQVMELCSNTTGTDHESQSMELGTDTSDGTPAGNDPVNHEGRKASTKAGQSQTEKRSHRMRFGRILNQTRASVSLAFESSSEDSGAVKDLVQNKEANHEGARESILLMQQGNAHRDNVLSQRRRSGTRTGGEESEGGGIAAVRLTNRHRNEVKRNIKRQPKRLSILDARVSNTLALSKEKLQSARDNMTRWRKQSEGLEQSLETSVKGGASSASTAAQRASGHGITPSKTNKELKKSSSFKMARRGSGEVKKLKSKKQKRRDRRFRSRRKSNNTGDDLSTARLEVVLKSCVEDGTTIKTHSITNRRRTSSSGTNVPYDETSNRTAASHRRPSSSSTAEFQKGASPTVTAVSQKRAPPSSTTVSRDRGPPRKTTVSQRRLSSSRTTQSQKGTSSSTTTEPHKGALSASQNVSLLIKSTTGNEGLKPETGKTSGSATVKCDQKDSMINEVPTRDVGTSASGVLKDPTSSESFNEHNRRHGTGSKEPIGQEVTAFQGLKCHNGAVCGMKVSGNHLFTCSADKTTKAFDLKTEKCVQTYLGHHLGVNCVEISDDGSRLFTGSNDQTVRSYNIKTCTCTHKFSFDGRVMCIHMAFGLLFVGLSTGIVTCIDLKENRCLERLHCHDPRGVSCLATATEGQRKLLCSGSFDSTITITDYESGLLLRTLKDHDMTVLCIQVVENVIYSGSADKRVQAHNLNTGELLRTYDGHSKSVSGLQIVGRVLVTSCLDKLIRCYDLVSAELLQVYGGQSDMLFSVHMANGRIFSGARDGSVSCVKLDLRVYHPCKWKDCSLKFGLVSHLKSHIQEYHVVQEGTIRACHWIKCQHTFLQEDGITAVLEHILSHAGTSKTRTPS